LTNPRAWAHVGLGARQELRAAFAAGLRDLVARHQPPVSVACPQDGGCLYCGRGSVSISAEQLSRLGGAQAATRAAWRPTTTTVTALGGTGPDRLTGHLCATCAGALEQVGGAVGLTSRAQAVVDHLVAHGEPQRARRLSDWLVEHEGANRVVPAWAVTGREPSGEPWEHLRQWVQGI
jgi:hypothetical protein